MSNEYVEWENTQRVPRYRKDNRIEDWLSRMNEALESVECYQPSGKDYPTVFVVGLPRSGTSLTGQLLAYCLDLGYINNLIARFWLAPLQGIMLSKAIIGNARDDSFISDYGKSVNIAGPHEFAYFWQHWLKLDSIDRLTKFEVNDTSIQWTELRRVVSGMQEVFSSGMIFKANYAMNHTNRFAETFSMPLFVYVQRDLFDVALSILQARKAYYGNYDTWWATMPPDYEALKGLPYYDQIAGQVISLRDTYERQFQSVSENIVVRVQYDDLCRSPRSLVEAVTGRLKSLYGTTVGVINEPPDGFELRERKTDLSLEEEAVVSALKRRAGS